MTTLRVEEVEANLREILMRVKAGETVEIESDGECFAQISPRDRFAALNKAYPDIVHATRHARDIELRPVPLTSPADSVAALIEDRADRDFLP